jgi:hypothetical protein
MSDELVRVPYSANNQETAVLLLAAAEELDLDSAVAVRTEEGNFVVPKEVADKAFGKGKVEAPETAKVQKEADEAAREAALRPAPSAEEGRSGYEASETAKTEDARKTTAKKSAPAKKAAAKKSASK